jgi:nucleoside-diphosphate-sugar epimerase
MKGTVAVTGATGFLGGALVHRMSKEGVKVIAVGREVQRGSALAALPNVIFRRADLSDVREAEYALSGASLVVHSAALSSPWGRVEDFERANVRATENVIQAAERNRATRFVYVSSPAVYFDFRARENIREDEPLPRVQVNDYARTKLEGECLTRAAHARGLPSVILRPRAIYGPGDTSILPRVVTALERGYFPLIDGGNARIDLTYIDDAVEALVCALHRGGALGGTFNITSADPQPLREIVDALADGIGAKRATRQVPFERAMRVAGALEFLHRISGTKREPRVTKYTLGLLAKTMTLDLHAARTHLGYVPKVSMREGLARWLQSRSHA